MSKPASEQFMDLLEERLKRIRKENGFSADVHVAEGWLQHIFSDPGLSRKQGEFPMVAWRPEVSQPSSAAPGNASVRDTLIFSVDVAVKVSDCDNPVRALMRLLKDVRGSIVFPPNSTDIKGLKVELLECPFDVPEVKDPFAFFSQRIKVSLNEHNT